MSIDANEIAHEVLEQAEKQRTALRLLLDQQLGKGQLVVTRAHMGHTTSFIGSVTLKWFAENVSFAMNLPLFKHKIDQKTNKIIIDHDTIQEISQRNPDWSRQSALTQYLVTRPNHKFPPVLVVLSRPWVDDPNSPEWGPEGSAMKSTATFTPLDTHGGVGLLDLGANASIYALDGQHRLMGAKGVIELMNSRALSRRTKDYKEVGTITIDELSEQYPGVTDSSIQSVSRETIGIEFIAAVNDGERRESARQRVRGIFVHVNMMASGLSKGEIALLNDDDGFAIIAKKAALEHDLLKDKVGVPGRVGWEKPNLVKASQAFTTIETLKEAAYDFLHFTSPFNVWRPSERGLVSIRPEEDQIEAGTDKFFEFLDHLSSLPSVKEMVDGGHPRELRLTGSEGGPSNGLMRPVVQRVIARAVGAIANEKNLALDSIFDRLRVLDENGGFRIDEPQSAFYGVLWELSNKIREAGRVPAVDILRFMLGGGFSEDTAREQLRSMMTLRRTDPVSDNVIGWDGNYLAPGVKLDLPQVL